MPKFYNKLLKENTHEKIWGSVMAEDEIDAKYRISLKYRKYMPIGKPISKEEYKLKLMTDLEGYAKV